MDPTQDRPEFSQYFRDMKLTSVLIPQTRPSVKLLHVQV